MGISASVALTMHFPNVASGIVGITKQKPNLRLAYVSPFSMAATPLISVVPVLKVLHTFKVGLNSHAVQVAPFVVHRALHLTYVLSPAITGKESAASGGDPVIIAQRPGYL